MKERNKSFNWFLGAVTQGLVSIIALVLFGGMILELAENPSSEYFNNYAHLSFTLFGFTFIAAIFESRNENKPVVKKISKINLMFLLAAISFFTIPRLIFFAETFFFVYLYNLLFASAYIFFVLGIVFLTLELLAHYKKN